MLMMALGRSLRVGSSVGLCVPAPIADLCRSLPRALATVRRAADAIVRDMVGHSSGKLSRVSGRNQYRTVLDLETTTN